MTLTSRQFLALIGTAAIAAMPGSASAKDLAFPFSAANFTHPLDITNTFFPLIPGTTFVYKAQSLDGCEEDDFTVTFDTKVVAGVTTRVIRDLAYEDVECDGVDDSELVEKTSDFHAQDNAGNVWYFGEETFHCNGASSCTLGSGSWQAGVDGAIAGVVMLASPHSGDSYKQELYPGRAEDQGSVMTTGYTAKLKREDAYPPGTFSDCIVTKEWSTLELGSIEQKTYCPGVGLVIVEEHHGKKLTAELTAPGAAKTDETFQFRTVPGNP
ncbi:MAG TPA: hypothetical protein VL553_01365 [Sphingomicrobium sp.]|jgi:hypothetical protein|nr:hypothetical protein [Sphingomicrobium sp.]